MPAAVVKCIRLFLFLPPLDFFLSYGSKSAYKVISLSSLLYLD